MHRERVIAKCGVLALGVALIPSLGTAAPPAQIQAPEPTPMDSDACDDTAIEIEYDVAAGAYYLIDPAGGSTEIDDNALNVGFDGSSTIEVTFSFTSDEWDVELTPAGGSTQYGTTSNGEYSFTASVSVDDYTLSFEAIRSGATSMLPTPPDIVLSPQPACPPPP